jgi:hypothetical protein
MELTIWVLTAESAGRLPPIWTVEVSVGAIVWPRGMVRSPTAALVLTTPLLSADQPWRTEPSAVVTRPRPSKESDPARV